MKRVDLIRLLESSGCVLVRHGGRHDWYCHPIKAVACRRLAAKAAWSARAWVVKKPASIVGGTRARPACVASTRRSPPVREIDRRSERRRQPTRHVEQDHRVERGVAEHGDIDVALRAVPPGGAATVEPCASQAPVWKSRPQFPGARLGQVIDRDHGY